MKNINERAGIVELLRQFHTIEPPTLKCLLEAHPFGDINIITSHFGLPAVIVGVRIFNRSTKPIQIAGAYLKASWTSKTIEFVNPHSYDELVYPCDYEEKDFINKRIFSSQPLAGCREIRGLLYGRLLDKFPDSRQSPVYLSLTIEAVDGQVCCSQLELQWLVDLPRTSRKRRVPLFGTKCPPAPPSSTAKQTPTDSMQAVLETRLMAGTGNCKISSSP